MEADRVFFFRRGGWATGRMGITGSGEGGGPPSRSADGGAEKIGCRVVSERAAMKRAMTDDDEDDWR